MRKLSDVLEYIKAQTSPQSAMEPTLLEGGVCGKDADLFNVHFLRFSNDSLVITGNGELGKLPSHFRDSVKNITVEEGITSIPDDAFRNYRALTDVSLGPGLTSLGAGSLSNNFALETVRAPDAVAEQLSDALENSPNCKPYLYDPTEKSAPTHNADADISL